MRKGTDPEEIGTHAIGAYVMLALAQLGGRVKSGNAGKALVAKQVRNMLKDRLKPCDLRKLYNGPDGIDWAPVGYPDDDTFPVWENNVSFSWKFAVIRGFVQTGNGYNQLTPRGYQYVFSLAEKCLAGDEEAI
jgi:hypothetical protein